jgi:cell division protein FtsB
MSETMNTQTAPPIQTLLRPGHLVHRFMGRMERRDALGILLMILIVSLVGWLYLTQVHITSATNLQIEQSRQKLREIEAENAALRVEIAKWESLPLVEERARALGFAPATSAFYMSVPGYSVEEVSAWEANRLEINP